MLILIGILLFMFAVLIVLLTEWLKEVKKING